jgi:hypothetical protein
MPLLIPLLSRAVVWTGAGYVATQIADSTVTTDNDIELEQIKSNNLTFGDVLLVGGAIAGSIYLYKKFGK